jgi:hypothetical protein
MFGRIKASRRGFLGALGAAPVVGKLAAKEMAEKEVASLGVPHGVVGAGLFNSSSTDREDLKKRAIRLPGVRRELYSYFMEQERTTPIPAIDVDIAVHRSFSLSAKVTYQRQRNAQRKIDEMENGYLWDRFDKILSAAARVLGIDRGGAT